MTKYITDDYFKKRLRHFVTTGIYIWTERDRLDDDYHLAT
jgi:hypothetical protein